MRKSSKGTLALSCASAVAVLCSGALAGGVNPPPGPVTGTMRTLAEVEPRIPLHTLAGDSFTTVVITSPGSYYLTGDLIAAPNKDGIKVAADHVTIDLNGFRLRGPGGLVEIGIVTSGNHGGFTIRNGVIENWGYASLNLGGFAKHALFEDLVLADNLAGGLEQNQVDHSIFRNIRAQASGETAIVAGTNCLVIGCSVDGSTAAISGLFNCTVKDCVVTNADRGIQLFSGGLVENCSVRGSAKGIVLGNGATGRGCSVSSCAVGIETTTGFARVEGCTVSFATTEGIRVLQRDQVGGSKVTNCPVGIVSQTAAGTRNVIDGNMVTSCPVGIRVLGTSNSVVRNQVTDAATAAFDVAPGNALGTVQATPVGAGAWDNISF